MLIFSFSLLSRHQALNRTPKYKQLLVKSSMALLCTNIFEKLMHTAPKKLHLPFQRQETWRVGYLRLIYCTAMLQFYQFQAECAFTQPSSSALEQMDWNLHQCRCWKWCEPTTTISSETCINWANCNYYKPNMHILHQSQLFQLKYE